MTNDRDRPRNVPAQPVLPTEQGQGHGSLVIVQERVLAEISHELGNFFHKLYYWSDYIKGDSEGTKSADATAGQMLERTIANLEDFLKIAVEYFYPVKLNFTRVRVGEMLDGFMAHLSTHLNGNQLRVLRDEIEEPAEIMVDPARISQAFRIAMRRVHDDLKSGGALTVSIGKGSRHDFPGLEIRLDIAPKTPSSQLRRSAEVGVEWAVAQKLVEMHGGEIAERCEPGGMRVMLVFLPLYV